MTLGEIATSVGASLDPEHASVEITGVAGVSDAEPGHLTFCAHPNYVLPLRFSKASAVLVSTDFSEKVSAILVKVENPTAAFGKVLQSFAPPAEEVIPGIHPSAVIAEGAIIDPGARIEACAVIETGVRIGRGTVIGAHNFIGRNAIIGEDCRFYSHVSLRDHCLVGHRVILHNGAVIGSDGFGYELVNGKRLKIPQTGIVQVDDDVEVGANTTIDRARFGKTWIQEGAKIDNLVQIGHNVTVGAHTILCAHVGISGSTKVGNYVTMAGKVGVNGHIEIGDGATITAMAGVTKSVPPKEMLVGLPARPIKEYKENFFQLRNIHKLYARVKKLEESKRAE